MLRTVNVMMALLLAAMVTFSLFFLMQYLIASGDELPERTERQRIADISIPELEIEVQRVTPKPQEPEEPEEIPDIPEPEFDLNAPVDNSLSVARVNVDMGGLDGGISFNQTDTEFLPIVTIAPTYPTRALQREIEGWCLVSFTVNEQGGVEDPFVVDAEPANMFDSASLRAVQRFKFNPKVVDGEPIKVEGVQYVFTYELAEE
ncbi:MAG: energy transducer TonB [Pseudohongiellaceae bacterium]